MDRSTGCACLISIRPACSPPSSTIAKADGSKSRRRGEDFRNKQFYWPDTNILVTRFLHADGIGEIEDYMPARRGAVRADELVRRVRVVRGKVSFRLECRPAFDYARAPAETDVAEHGVRFDGPGSRWAWLRSVPLEPAAGGVSGDFTLNEGEQRLSCSAGSAPMVTTRLAPASTQAEDLFRATVGYWRRWLSKCTYTGRWREIVERSALALKLLVVRADRRYRGRADVQFARGDRRPTQLGLSLHLDSRRGVHALRLLRIGFTDEVVHFMDWLKDRWQRADGRGTVRCSRCTASTAGPTSPRRRSTISRDIVALTRADRQRRPPAVAVGHLRRADGRRLSAQQVRRTNRLRRLDAAAALVDWLCENWRATTTASGKFAAAHGRLCIPNSCAGSRSIAACGSRTSVRFPPIVHAGWRVRDEIYEEVMNQRLERKSPGVRAVLRFRRPGRFEPADAARILHGPERPAHAQHDRRDSSAARPGGLDRQRTGLSLRSRRRARRSAGPRGHVQHVLVLARRGADPRRPHRPARLEDARLLFEQMLGYSNHLGLYAEQTERSGEALGNFPQAFTHLGLISAAFNLDRAPRGGIDRLPNTVVAIPMPSSLKSSGPPGTSAKIDASVAG